MMRTSPHPRRQHGAVIITVALVMLFLLGFMGFALDLGRLFVVRDELQTAVDSCALSAAQELDRSSTAITRATNAGAEVGNRNRVNLQSANWDGKGQLSAASLRFMDANLVTTTDPTLAHYAECQHTQPAVRLWLLQAMGAFMGDAQNFPSTQNVMARATATRASAQTVCPVPLLLRPKTAGAGPPNYGYTPGEWITLVTGGGAGSNGYVGWANLDGSNSASETEDELLQGYCGVREDTVVGTPGVQSSIADAWNSRFGIYRNVGTVAAMPPDVTGYAYTTTNWPTGASAYDGATPAGAHGTAANYTTKRDALASCADTTTSMNTCESIIGYNIGSGFNKVITPGPAPTPVPNNPPDAHWMGVRSKRLVLVPVSNSYPGRIEDYACMLMLQPMPVPMADIKLEFIGNGGAINSPCTTSGTPGGSGGPLVPVLVR